jgi:CO/xanthine dehydrogenase Mo-binding subunit
VDAQGTITAWFFEDRTLPWRNTQPLAALLMNRQDDPGTAGQNGSGCAGQDYAFANYRGVSLRLPWPNKQDTGLRTNNLRAPGDPGRAFASESFLDEIASALGADPVQFRLRHITDQRMIDVINAAAGRAGRQTRPSPRTDVPRTGVVTGQGFAFARRNTYVAAAAEVEVDQDTGQVRVTRLVVAHDCGLIINPDSVLQQVETQVVQTVGRTLHEEVVFDQFSVTSQDWLSYPYLKPAEVPDVEVILINRPELNPSGVGEPACNPIPPAIANAIFDATGVRLREVPFTQARVKKALDERA